MTHDVLIRSARVVTSGSVSRCDIGVTQGRIAALGDDLSGHEVFHVPQDDVGILADGDGALVQQPDA